LRKFRINCAIEISRSNTHLDNIVFQRGLSSGRCAHQQPHGAFQNWNVIEPARTSDQNSIEEAL
jgi:hypothetical protein